MAVLTGDIKYPDLCVEFAVYPKRVYVEKYDWPADKSYRDNVFFRFSIYLIDTIGCLAQNSVDLDRYDFTQIDDPEDVYRLSSDFLLQAHALSRRPLNCFQDDLEIYEDYERFTEGETPTPEHLKYDLIDTLLFLSGRLNQIAFSGQCLIIAGI